jgi:hypothetical protein
MGGLCFLATGAEGRKVLVLARRDRARSGEFRVKRRGLTALKRNREAIAQDGREAFSKLLAAALARDEIWQQRKLLRLALVPEFRFDAETIGVAVLDLFDQANRGPSTFELFG